MYIQNYKEKRKDFTHLKKTKSGKQLINIISNYKRNYTSKWRNKKIIYVLVLLLVNENL